LRAQCSWCKHLCVSGDHKDGRQGKATTESLTNDHATGGKVKSVKIYECKPEATSWSNQEVGKGAPQQACKKNSLLGDRGRKEKYNESPVTTYKGVIVGRPDSNGQNRSVTGPSGREGKLKGEKGDRDTLAEEYTYIKKHKRTWVMGGQREKANLLHSRARGGGVRQN